MPKNNTQFVVDIDRFVSKSELTVNQVRANMAYELFSRVIDRTPVYFSFEPESGNTKYNWTCTINAPATNILKGTDKSGTKTKDRMLKVIERVQGDETIFLANSTPQIWSLEYGLYPKSPKRGSYNRQTGKYEIRSQGGFSKQAPSGMVRLTLTEVPQIRAQAIRKAKALSS